MSNCVKICTTTDLGDPTRNSGYIRAFDNKIYWSNGEEWLEISNIENVENIRINGETIIKRESFNYKITDIELFYPNSGFTIELNGSPYVIGTEIHIGDILSFYSPVPNNIKITYEKVLIETLNIIPRLIYEENFSYTAGVDFSFLLGVTNISNTPTTAPFVFYLQKIDPFGTVYSDSVMTSVTMDGAVYTTSNSLFTVVEQATRWRFTSNTGVILNPYETIWVGAGIEDTSIGSASLTVTVVNGTGGGETPTTDNILVRNLNLV